MYAVNEPEPTEITVIDGFESNLKLLMKVRVKGDRSESDVEEDEKESER
jgi:hypothetical protein